MIEVSTEYISCFDMIQEYDKMPTAACVERQQALAANRLCWRLGLETPPKTILYQ